MRFTIEGKFEVTIEVRKEVRKEVKLKVKRDLKVEILDQRLALCKYYVVWEITKFD